MEPDYQRLRRRLIIDEAAKLQLYTDSVGKISIGVGRNLTDKGIRPSELILMLNNDLKEAEQELLTAWPWMIGLDQVRMEVMINMSFNMGVTVLSQFKNTINYLRLGEYDRTAFGMRNSKWYKQVGERAERLATMMETGIAII